MAAPHVALLLAACAPQDGAAPSPGVDFAREVRPLLARRCFACHGNDESTREAGLRLDVRADAVADRGGFPAIVPGDPEASELWIRITDDVDPMPPEHAGDMLEGAERDLVRRWIEQGAPYERHWAFVPPVRPEVPPVPGAGHPIDAFVRRALAARGLEPSRPADDATLLRRLSLDLTGLPPTVDEVRAFLASEDPGKVDAAVERLLASPAYAERWAAVWLDLARYADSAGHGSDPLRIIWRYRDWVIEAFDRNLPFDAFTVQQLAGDLLPGAGMEERLATAFHRNTMTNTEGGTDDEEFRVLAVKDRVNTTMQVWMGLTAGCAECHSHKYDPISQREYYALFDIFNQTADADRANEAPLLDTPTREQQAEHARLTAALEEVEGAASARRAALEAAPELEAALVARASAARAAFDASGVTAVTGDAGETVRRRDDGSWFVESERAAAVRTVHIAAGADAPGALRLDVLADDALPGGGPGLSAGGGNFVLTDLRVRALPAAGAGPVTARRVRVELPGEGRILSLAEVELVGPGGRPVDVGARARQSSTAYGGSAELALDGDTNGAHGEGSVTHTATEDGPWWEAELAAEVELAGVRLWTRTDGDLASRLHGVRVVLLDGDGRELWRSAPAPAFATSSLVGPAVGEPLLLELAGATHEQRGFEARKAVDALPSDRDGWAVAGGEGRDQAAVFSLPPLGEPRALEVTLEHRWGSEHVLGRFAVSVAPPMEGPPTVLSAAAAEAFAVPPSERSGAQRRAALAALSTADPELAALEARRAELEGLRLALGVVRTPVMEELPADRRRQTHVLVRGNFLQKGERVHAGVPAAFGALEAPADRLALARWLVSPENPLTARVAVNRVWARLFGTGIVATEGDFGNQGALPTHPELLDWLAVEFVESGWDHRQLLRTIVSSRTYRQASRVTERARELDPDGEWLSRYPRQRLEAEMVRDVTLGAAGLLSPKRFGPSVFPPQPDGLWQAAFNGQRSWMESAGEDRYRRGIYVFLRRTIPYPMLDVFDAPSRELCTVQRTPTNTPLQAFVTLNDPVFVEAAQALGRELYALDGQLGARDTVREALWRVTSRPPDEAQVGELIELLADMRAAFDGGVPEADLRALVEDPLGPVPEGTHLGRMATWTIIASTALNMDAVLTKE